MGGPEISVPVSGDPPKIIAHRPILIERASCPQHPRDCNYGGKADHASEADQHDVEIIAWMSADRPRRAESHERTHLRQQHPLSGHPSSASKLARVCGTVRVQQWRTSSPYSVIGGWINPAAFMRTDLDTTSDPYRDRDFTGGIGIDLSPSGRRSRQDFRVLFPKSLPQRFAGGSLKL